MLSSSPFCRDLIRVSSLSSASVVDLAGLVVCAKDGLDVDLLVSSSLDGWEEESDLLLADTGQEAAAVDGVVSCCRGLVAVVLLLGVVLLPELLARLASERGEVHGEEVRGRTRAGLGADSRAGSTVAIR